MFRQFNGEDVFVCEYFLDFGKPLLMPNPFMNAMLGIKKYNFPKSFSQSCKIGKKKFAAQISRQQTTFYMGSQTRRSKSCGIKCFDLNSSPFKALL